MQTADPSRTVLTVLCVIFAVVLICLASLSVYRLADTVAARATPAAYDPAAPPKPTLEERVAALEEENARLKARPDLSGWNEVTVNGQTHLEKRDPASPIIGVYGPGYSSRPLGHRLDPAARNVLSGGGFRR
jgi:hypothetical protein